LTIQLAVHGWEETSHDWGAGGRWPQEHDGERGLLVGRTLSPVSSYLHLFWSPVFLVSCVYSTFLLRVPWSVLRFCSPVFASVCPLSSPRVVRPWCPPILLVLGKPWLRRDSCCCLPTVQYREDRLMGATCGRCRTGSWCKGEDARWWTTPFRLPWLETWLLLREGYSAAAGWRSAVVAGLWGDRGDEGIFCNTGWKPVWWLLKDDGGWRQRAESATPDLPLDLLFFSFFFFTLFRFFFPCNGLL